MPELINKMSIFDFHRGFNPLTTCSISLHDFCLSLNFKETVSVFFCKVIPYFHLLGFPCLPLLTIKPFVVCCYMERSKSFLLKLSLSLSPPLHTKLTKRILYLETVSHLCSSFICSNLSFPVMSHIQKCHL